MDKRNRWGLNNIDDVRFLCLFFEDAERSKKEKAISAISPMKKDLEERHALITDVNSL